MDFILILLQMNILGRQWFGSKSSERRHKVNLEEMEIAGHKSRGGFFLPSSYKRAHRYAKCL